MRPLSELPNTSGFRFVGIRHDGTRVECRRTTTRDFNWHDIAPGHSQSVYNHELAGWEPVEVDEGRCDNGTCDYAAAANGLHSCVNCQQTKRAQV